MRHRLVIFLLAACLAVHGLAHPAMAQRGEADFRFIVFEELITLDPQKMTWLADIRIAQCLFEPLVVMSLPSQTLEGGAADRWEVSPDQRTYTFHIRAAARWSNGAAVTSHDFYYAWRRALLPDLASDYTQLFYRIAGAEDFFRWRSRQLEAYVQGPRHSPAAAQALWLEAQKHFAQTVGLATPDDHTLVVHLAHPTPYFLELASFTTFMPVHAASVSAQTSINAATGAVTQEPGWTKPGKLISNGPYQLTRWRFKRDLLLTANEHYWNRAHMANRSILQRYIPDLQVALLFYLRGEVDWIPDLPTARSIVADLVAAHRPDVHLFPVAGTYFYNFNCAPTLADGTPNPLADARVRRALALGIDRRVLVEKVTRLHQPIARTFVPPDIIPGYPPPTAAGADFDPAAAQKLLAQAGYPAGRGLNGLSILYNTEGGHEDIAQQIKNSWEKHLGVIVQLEGVEKRVFGDRLRRHDFTISRAAWIGDYRDPSTFLDKFVSTNGNNDAAYNHPRYDQLLQSADQETNADRRLATLRQAEALMLADQPIAPLFHYLFVDIYDPRKVTGLYQGPWNFHRLEFVRVHHDQ